MNINLSNEMLIAVQGLIFLLLVAGMLILLLRRQKKTIRTLQQALGEYRDDISGNHLARHLQTEIDNTTAHCQQDTVALQPDLAPADLAIALRYGALQNELSLCQGRQSAQVPWRDQIKGYEELAQKIHEFQRDQQDKSTRALNEIHKEELTAKDIEYQSLDSIRHNLEQQINQLKPLQEFVGIVTLDPSSPQDIEQKLHRALLAICENFPHTEKLRELVYLLHEAYNESLEQRDDVQP